MSNDQFLENLKLFQTQIKEEGERKRKEEEKAEADKLQQKAKKEYLKTIQKKSTEKHIKNLEAGRKINKEYSTSNFNKLSPKKIKLLTGKLPPIVEAKVNSNLNRYTKLPPIQRKTGKETGKGR